jgi:hypothetical protein
MLTNPTASGEQQPNVPQPSPALDPPPSRVNQPHPSLPGQPPAMPEPTPLEAKPLPGI